MKRLIRSNEKIVAGVISGISNYINPEWDPVFLRIVFILITYYNPALILIYFGLAFIIPVEDLKFKNSETTSSSVG
jgi:phage shock protein C